jgi:hypothetical protein
MSRLTAVCHLALPEEPARSAKAAPKTPTTPASQITRSFLICVLAMVVALSSVLLATAQPAAASLGSQLRTLSPSPSGNGRAVALDPVSGHLFYTNRSDPDIYVIDTSGNSVATLNTVDPSGSPVSYGALAWGNGVLWGGRYDGTGQIDEINPTTGAVTPEFQFSYPIGDSCYYEGHETHGKVDGLAFDPSDRTLWTSDDNAHTVFHIRTDGTTIGQFTVPNGLCNTGIAVSSRYLWLGLQSGPDEPPYQVARLSKNNPSSFLSTFSIVPEGGPGTQGGPEGLALDSLTFPGKCALWTNQFGFTTTLTAWELERSACRQGGPVGRRSFH